MSTEKIKPIHSEETRLALLEQSINTINDTLVRFEKRFDNVDSKFQKIDDKLDSIKKELKSDFRWLLTIISGIGAIMAHGFHWF